MHRLARMNGFALLGRARCFWRRQSADTVMLEGCDPGVSFRTVHDPRSHITHTVISSSSDGAWPITRRLAT